MQDSFLFLCLHWFIWLRFAAALYTDQAIVVSVDVSIQIYRSNLQKANSNIQDIVQTALQNTNHDVSYLHILTIYNSSQFDSEVSFRYHALFNIYCISESEYRYAVANYRDIFSVGRSLASFIQIYENNIHQSLLRTLNIDSLSPNAVHMNALNMIEGSLIMSYNERQKTTSTTQVPLAATARDPNSFVKRNLPILFLFGGIFMLICFCCTMVVFWKSSHSSNSDRTDDIDTKQNMYETQQLKLGPMSTGTTANTNRESDSWISANTDEKDPFEWSSGEVTLWLRQQGLFSATDIHLNGKDLLTTPEQKGLDIIMAKDSALLNGIKKLRLESNSYCQWKLETAINELNEDDHERSINDCIYLSNGSDDECSKSQSHSKKVRKPPKRLRRKANRERRKRSDNSMSFSSTMEVQRKSCDMGSNSLPLRLREQLQDYSAMHLQVPCKEIWESNHSGHDTEPSIGEHEVYC